MSNLRLLSYIIILIIWQSSFFVLQCFRFVFLSFPPFLTIILLNQNSIWQYTLCINLLAPTVWRIQRKCRNREDYAMLLVIREYLMCLLKRYSYFEQNRNLSLNSDYSNLIRKKIYYYNNKWQLHYHHFMYNLF